jgi:hypothetical protein
MNTHTSYVPPATTPTCAKLALRLKVQSWCFLTAVTIIILTPHLHREHNAM